MDAREFTAALAELDLTKASAARFFGVSLRSIVSWTGTGSPPQPVTLLVRYMLAKGITPSEVAKAAGEPGPHSPPKKR